MRLTARHQVDAVGIHGQAGHCIQMSHHGMNHFTCIEDTRHLSTSRSLKDSFFSSQNNSESLCTQCLWSGSCETWSHQSGSPSLEWWTQLGSSCRLTWLVIKEFDVSIFMSSDGYWKRGMTHHLIYMIWPRQSWGGREKDNTVYCPQKPITHLISVHGCLCSYCHLPVLWAQVLAGKFPGHTQPRLRY